MPFERLTQSFLFAGFSAAEIEQLLAPIAYRIHTYEKGETLFQPFEPARLVGILLSGSVQSYKLFPNGNQVNVTIRKAGDVIGPAAALAHQHKYPFGVSAREDTVVLLMEREEYLRLLGAHPALVQNALTEMATITYMLQQRLELLSYHGISQKIAFYLLSESLQKETTKVRIPGSMTQWAMIMNVSRPSLHRELKKLEDLGLVKIGPTQIELCDLSALEQLLYQ